MSGAYSAYNSTFTWTSDCDCYDATAVPSGFNGTIKHNMGADSFKGFTWTGNDTDGYTAAVGNYECSGSAKAKISVDAKLESADTSTCTVDGTVTYTATIAKADSPDGIEHTEDKTISGKATGHDWGEPTYTWADDNSSVTATRVCKKDETHVETETVSTTSEVTKEATCTAKGETTYTATFTKEAFSTQTKTVEDVDIDPDAHDWQAAKGASDEDIEECSHCHERRRGESPVTLDLSKSSHRDKRLTITPTGYVQDDGKEIAYTGAYILTGGITANTPLVFSNNTGEAYTFDVTFDNVTIGSGTYETTIVLTGSSDIQLDLKVVGDNTIAGATNHTAFKRYWAPTNKVTINISLEEDAALTITKSTAGTYSDLTWISDCGCYDATAVPGAFTGTIRHHPPFKGFTWTGDDESGYTAAVGHFECNVVSRDVDATVTSEDTPATCTEDGVTTYTATIAKADSPDEAEHTETKTVTSKATGHDWGEWTVTREATEDAEGEEERTCARCHELEKRAIPKVTYYDITYVLAGGNVDGSAGPIVERHAGGEQIAIMKEPTREGYTFQYWEGSRYNPGDAYTVVEDHTFTAVWQKDAEPEPKPDDKPSGKVVPKTGGDVAPARSALPETGDVTSNQLAVLFGAAGAALITVASRRKREE